MTRRGAVPAIAFREPLDVEPEPRGVIGGWVVLSDTFPGSWGAGTTEPEAEAAWRRAGGRGPSIRVEVDPFWCRAWVDCFGAIRATVTDPESVSIPHRDRPPVIAAAWRVSRSGRRAPLDNLDA